MNWNSVGLALALAIVSGSASAAPPDAPERPAPITLRKPAMIHLGQIAPESNAVPKGSYLESCRHMAMEQGVLSAECDNGRGSGFASSSLEAARCGTSDIFNRFGVLQCSTAVRANWSANVLPPGSYLATCAAHVDGTRLVAACGTGVTAKAPFAAFYGHEGSADTSLDLSRCPDGNDIANIHGELVCVAH